MAEVYNGFQLPIKQNDELFRKKLNQILTRDAGVITPLQFANKSDTDDSTAIGEAIAYAQENGIAAVTLPDVGTPWLGANLDFDGVSLVNRGSLQLTTGNAMTVPLATFSNGAGIYGGTLLGSPVTGTVSNLHGLIKTATNPNMQVIGVKWGRTYYGALILDEESPDLVMIGGGMLSIFKHGIIDRSGGATVMGAYFTGVGYGDGHVIRYGRFASDPLFGTPLYAGTVQGCTFRYSVGNGVLCEFDARDARIIGNDYAYGANFVKCDTSSNVEDITIIGNVESFLSNAGSWDPDTEVWTPGVATLSAAALAVKGMVYKGNRQLDCARRCDFGADGIIEGNYWNNCGDGTELIRFINTDGDGGSFTNNGGEDLQGYINLANSSNVTVANNRRMSFASGISATRIGGDGHTVRFNDFVSAGGTATGLSFLSTTTNATVTDNNVSTFSTPISYGVNASVTSNIVVSNSSLIQPTFTIASGVITVFRLQSARIDTEGGAATDDLDTISTTNVPVGWATRFSSSANAKDPTLKNGTGNLVLASDCTLSTTSNWITLIYDGTMWKELNRG